MVPQPYLPKGSLLDGTAVEGGSDTAAGQAATPDGPGAASAGAGSMTGGDKNNAGQESDAPFAPGGGGEGAAGAGGHTRGWFRAGLFALVALALASHVHAFSS